MGKTFTVQASAPVGAPAEVVYNIIADYRKGHPHILPRKYFEWLEVEQGGRGEVKDTFHGRGLLVGCGRAIRFRFMGPLLRGPPRAARRRGFAGAGRKE